jgi:O-antigen/teichoic acid export membrane protein
MRFSGRRITWNALWLLAGRVSTQVLIVAFMVIVARRLGESGFGQYAFIASIIFLANVATTFGTDMLVIRTVAAENSLNTIPAAIAVQLALSLVAIGVLILVPGSWLNLTEDGAAAFRIYSFALFPMSIVSVVSAGLRGLEKMRIATALGTGNVLLQVLLTWFFVVGQDGIVVLMKTLLAVQIVTALAGVWAYIRITPRGEPIQLPSVQSVVETLRASFSMALLSGLGIFYQRAAIYMMMLLSGATATGWFSAAWRAVEVPKLGHYSLMGALLPSMARSHTSDNYTDSRSPLFAGSFYASLGVSTAAALVMCLAAYPLITVVFGPGFDPAVHVLQILAWVLLPYTVTNYLSLRVLVVGEEHRLLVPQLVSALVLIPLCIWAIPRWGAPAAAGAVVAAEILLAVGYSHVWWNVRQTHQGQV